MTSGTAISIGSASDASYHKRHAHRSQRRAECIASYISEPAKVLDVGCNIGITSKHLLDTGNATHVTGVELSADTVSPSLRSDQRFHLIEGNIVEIEFNGRFDVCIYGAVHHHVLSRFGIGAAVAVLQRLAACSDKTLFFETGQLGEGGRWSWQGPLFRHFRTDEAHIYYLLACIEPLIKGFHVIGRFWIHGIRRWYLKIDLVEPSERHSPPLPGPRVSVAIDPAEMYARTRGSENQRFIPLESKEARDSPSLFGIAERRGGGSLFLKRHVHLPSAGMREYIIGSQCPEEWAVRCIGFADDASTLVFPLVPEAMSIEQAVYESNAYRRAIAQEVLRIFRAASNVKINMERRFLLPVGGKMPLLELCDFNLNNWLVIDVDGVPRICVIDFEQQSCRYIWRNRLHLARILLRLKHNRARALLEFARGLMGGLCLLCQYQALSLERRIRDRQPSVLSIVVAFARTYAGRIADRILKIAWIR